MRFVYLDSRFTLHASSPRSVALAQLRFACLAVASLAGDLHPEECAHAGRTRKRAARRSPSYVVDGPSWMVLFASWETPITALHSVTSWVR